MARRLVGQKIDGNIFVHRVLEEINDIAIKGNRYLLLFILIFFCHPECLFRGFGNKTNPTLGKPCLDSRLIYFRNNSNTIRNFYCFSLGSAHTSETGRDKKMSAHVSIARKVKL